MSFLGLLKIVTPSPRALVWILGLLLASTATSLVQPWIAGQLTAGILAGPESGRTSITFILGFWLLVLVARSLLHFASDYLTGTSSELMGAGLRGRLYQHLQLLPMTYFHQQRPGDVLTLLANDAEVVSDFVTGTLLQVLPQLLTFCGALLLMLWIDVRIGLLAGALMPCYFLVMKLIGRRIRPLSRAWIDSYSDLFSLVEENLKMMPVLKSFTREPHETGRFHAVNQRLLGLSRRQVLLQAVMAPAVGLLAGLGLLILLWLGAAEMDAGRLDAADLVSLLLYAMLLSNPLRGLAGVYGQFQQTRGAAERLLEFFSQQKEPEDGDIMLHSVSGEIVFSTIGFGYGGDTEVLKDLELHIKAGETVAIIGENGAGKSTLVHLLMRFADPGSGVVLIDGVDIRRATLHSLRQQVGLVSQNTLLLNASVAENIAYGEPYVARERVEEAARVAQAAEFISRLPQGYDTLIGDQGLKLSGGQRQRLALARALLKNPPILVLDEATAMFDPAGEDRFIAEGREWMEQRTVLLITHRAPALALADRILELRDGRLKICSTV